MREESALWMQQAQADTGEMLLENAAELSPEYVLTRYPTPEVALPVELYSRSTAERHLQAMERLLEWATHEMESG